MGRARFRVRPAPASRHHPGLDPWPPSTTARPRPPSGPTRRPGPMPWWNPWCGTASRSSSPIRAGRACRCTRPSPATEDRIRTILPRHEQGGIFAAEGYARVTGRPGVVMATSGPGALNLVTGLADAKMDSLPIVAITGQVPTKVIGTDAFQETPTVEVCRAITKHSYLVQNARDIPRIVKEAFHLAGTGRPGPVLIDVPKDIQNTLLPDPDYDAPMDLPGYRLPQPPSAELVEAALAAIRASRKPIIYCGGGVIASGRGRGPARVRQEDRHPGRHDLAGARVDPQRPLPVAGDARHARHRLLEPGDQRRRPPAGLRRPVRRPRHRQALRVRQARQDRPRRHRRLGDQQEQDRPRRRSTPT